MRDYVFRRSGTTLSSGAQLSHARSSSAPRSSTNANTCSCAVSDCQHKPQRSQAGSAAHSCARHRALNSIERQWCEGCRDTSRFLRAWAPTAALPYLAGLLFQAWCQREELVDVGSKDASPALRRAREDSRLPRRSCGYLRRLGGSAPPRDTGASDARYVADPSSERGL